MRLGVCYYPEHWPEAWCAEDAAAMAALGVSTVRIGEFAWSRIEPEPGRFEWGWLDRAIDTLARAGLEITLGTPTATPPKWLIDRHPDILAVDRRGRPRRFGSRRHYCFSSLTYRRETARIVEAVAQRYGAHPAVTAWQTDNEYGCHDTVESFSEDARVAFRAWLARRYGDVATLNAAWGNVFWSMEYRSFDEIDPPNETVTEANPAHRMDWRRFGSDEVVAYNRLQVEILRAHAPGRTILHNFMGSFTQFDHHAVGADLDVATWDSYPLGFLEQGHWPAETKARYLRQGHPDFTAFHHDLYRGVGRGRWWVMEQQPGPVNWAPYNPAPLPGMVRAWTWEAFAHGAEVVSYFRWRQAPFAQEQMHAGLHRPDRVEAPAAGEARQVAREIKTVPDDPTPRAPVALIFDYQAQWLFEIQPQGASYRHFELALDWYGALRRLGLDVDVVAPEADLSGYAAIVAPALPFVTDALAARLAQSNAVLLFGPRAGSKTARVTIPDALAPGALQALLPIKVTRVESLRPGVVEAAGAYGITRWLEHVEAGAGVQVHAKTPSGAPVWLQAGRAHYLAGWPCARLLDDALRAVAGAAGLSALDLPQDLRLRRRGRVRFAVNYGPQPIDLAAHVPGAAGFAYRLGGPHLEPAGVAAWVEA
ncbi:MAG: beta-galactosidase [Alphaproteobacteria bacterium]|nr:beta-galactosidase [Alphaproteobacteria bacterium]